MRRFSVQEVADALGAGQLVGDFDFADIATDTRKMPPGALFVALTGERFDGHDFIDDAIAHKACAAVVSHPVEAPIAQIRVPDTLRALGQLGRLNRREFGGTLVGITGSAGKTGTREMTAAVLGGADTVLATRGNLNNEVGVPLTLLQIAPRHRYAVIEMGAGREGDIAYLAEWAEPEIGLVTNAMSAHVAGMGSIEEIATTKGALYTGLHADGVAILNIDDAQASLWRAQIAERRIVSWSLHNPAATVYAAAIDTDKGGRARFSLHLGDQASDVRLAVLGRHQVANALAAAAVGHALGRSIDQVVSGLQTVRPIPGRLMPLRGRHGSFVIDDSYNANPGSMAAAIELLGSFKGRRVLLLGDMAELGEEAAQRHVELGELARVSGIDQLLAVGNLSEGAVQAFGAGARHFDTWQQLAVAAKALQCADMTLLVKGSRSAGMERVVAELQRAPAQGAS